MEQELTENIRVLVEYNSRLLDFNCDDLQRLRRARETLLACSDEVVAVFYDRLFAVEQTRKVFKEGERAIRERTMRDWYVKTICADIDDSYWLWQWLVGALHVKRGVENPMMISMMSVVQSVVLRKVVEALGEKEGVALYASFCKLTSLVVSLVIKSYEDSTFEAMKHATGMSRELIATNVTVGLDRQIETVSNALSH